MLGEGLERYHEAEHMPRYTATRRSFTSRES